MQTSRDCGRRVVGCAKKSLSQSVRDCMPEEPTQGFWVEHYYNVMTTQFSSKSAYVKETVKQAVSSAQELGIRSPDAKKQEVNMTDVDMLRSNFIAGEAYEASAMELPAPTYIGSADLFNEDVRGSRFICEGILVDRDENPRVIQPRGPGKSPKRGSLPEEPSTVLDLLVIDQTGPVRIQLWGVAVDHFLKLMESVDTTRVQLRFEPMRKALQSSHAASGPSLTPIPVLHSIPATSNREGTIVSILQNPSSPYLTSMKYVPPTTDVCITKFYPVRSQLSPPFRASFRGMATDVRGLDATQQGSPVREFDLVDETGVWIKCCAWGRNSRVKNLVDGQEVILYFATAKSGAGGVGVCLWLFKDAFLAVMGPQTPTRVKRIELDWRV